MCKIWIMSTHHDPAYSNHIYIKIYIKIRVEIGQGIFSETLVSLVYLTGEKSKIHISFESKQIELSSGTKIIFIEIEIIYIFFITISRFRGYTF